MPQSFSLLLTFWKVVRKHLITCSFSTPISQTTQFTQRTSFTLKSVTLLDRLVWNFFWNTVWDIQWLSLWSGFWAVVRAPNFSPVCISMLFSWLISPLSTCMHIHVGHLFSLVAWWSDCVITANCGKNLWLTQVGKSSGDLHHPLFKCFHCFQFFDFHKWLTCNFSVKYPSVIQKAGNENT